MYPFLKQLISYSSHSSNEKMAMLILDVKGNFHHMVKLYTHLYQREDDFILISLHNTVTYNPLDKPKLKPLVLANRLKTILTLFSPNQTESYWLDKAEMIIAECIKFCRLYNQNYVTFYELHQLVSNKDYYVQKLHLMRQRFLKGELTTLEIFDLLEFMEFMQLEFFSLDPRTAGILKSEITRITSLFVSDYDIFHTFCPEKEAISFHGFTDVLEHGKIVVLDMNIAEYQNLSKIIAAYLKLDFQSEILSKLSHTHQVPRISCFMCDEYHEYVTITDADFYAQSREAKCINIVATQSYTSLLNTLKNQSSTNVIIQNLINKLWFRTDDNYTIEEAKKQIGKIEKEKITKTISENAKESKYHYLFQQFTSTGSNISESINTSFSQEFIFDSNYFSSKLQTFSCIAFLSDGNQIMPPEELKLFPYFYDLSQNNLYHMKGFDLHEHF